MFPEAFGEVLSRFSMVHKALGVTLAQFYIWKKFAIIGESLIRRERKCRGRFGLGAIGALSLVRVLSDIPIMMA